MTWISVKDRPPALGEAVLVWVPSAGINDGYPDFAYLDSDGSTWWACDDNEEVHPSHWAPMSAIAPPKDPECTSPESTS